MRPKASATASRRSHTVPDRRQARLRGPRTLGARKVPVGRAGSGRGGLGEGRVEKQLPFSVSMAAGADTLEVPAPPRLAGAVVRAGDEALDAGDDVGLAGPNLLHLEDFGAGAEGEDVADSAGGGDLLGEPHLERIQVDEELGVYDRVDAREEGIAVAVEGDEAASRHAAGEVLHAP